MMMMKGRLKDGELCFAHAVRLSDLVLERLADLGHMGQNCGILVPLAAYEHAAAEVHLEDPVRSSSSFASSRPATNFVTI